MQIEMMVVVRFTWDTNKRAWVKTKGGGRSQYKLSCVLSGGFVAGAPLRAIRAFGLLRGE